LAMRGRFGATTAPLRTRRSWAMITLPLETGRRASEEASNTAIQSRWWSASTWRPARMVHGRTFRSHAGSERHELIDPIDPLPWIPLSAFLFGSARGNWRGKERNRGSTRGRNNRQMLFPAWEIKRRIADASIPPPVRRPPARAVEHRGCAQTLLAGFQPPMEVVDREK
jgi:hypothetical protein